MTKVPYDRYVGGGPNENLKHSDKKCTTCNHTRSAHLYTMNKNVTIFKLHKPNECIYYDCSCKRFTFLSFELEIERIEDDI